MSNHVGIRPHSAPFFWTSQTIESNSLSPCCFRLPYTAPPLISVFCCGQSQTSPSMGRAIPLWHEGSLNEDESVSFLHIQPISNEAHFDRVVAEAQQREEAIVIVWMASWCRKCIYLKPKLEKLAADYYPRLRFYSVDVNTVSYKLVARAGVTLPCGYVSENANHTTMERQQETS